MQYIHPCRWSLNLCNPTFRSEASPHQALGLHDIKYVIFCYIFLFILTLTEIKHKSNSSHKNMIHRYIIIIFLKKWLKNVGCTLWFSLAQIRFRGRHYACSVGCPVMHDSLGSSMPQFDRICFWTLLLQMGAKQTARLPSYDVK